MKLKFYKEIAKIETEEYELDVQFPYYAQALTYNGHTHDQYEDEFDEEPPKNFLRIEEIPNPYREHAPEWSKDNFFPTWLVTTVKIKKSDINNKLIYEVHKEEIN